MASINKDNAMAKQRRSGWKRGSDPNKNEDVPDFGDLTDADCAVVEAKANLDFTDALSLPYEPRQKHENRPLSPGAIVLKAKQDAAKINTSTVRPTKITRMNPESTFSFWKLPMKEETENSGSPHLDYLFDFECKAGSLTYDPETCKPYEIIDDPNDFSKSSYVPMRETLQAEPIFELIDPRVTPGPKEPVTIVTENGGDKKRKSKRKRKSKMIVDADVEMLENWAAEVDDKPVVDYGKLRKEQRKRFEKMGIYR